jgi:membrane protease YdiL (CAAX protease family)
VQSASGRTVIPARPAEPVGWPVWAAAIMLYMGVLVVPGVQALPPGGLIGAQRYCAATAAFVVLGPWLMSRAYAFRWSDFGLWRQGWGVDVLLGAAGFVASLLPVYGIALPLHHIRQDHPHKMVQLLEGTGWQGHFWIAVTAVIAAPLLEELVYRVILQGTLETSMKKGYAVAISSIVFAAVHMFWADVIPLIPLALILGTIYARRRSYIAVVVLHGLFNAFGLFLTLTTRP